MMYFVVMPGVFISHAHSDAQLVASLIHLLQDGIGVPRDAIFCSSARGHGVPIGADYNDGLRTRLGSSSLALALVTPSYIDRPFCMMELGACWAMGLRTIPIVTCSADRELVNATLGLRQSWLVQDDDGLFQLKGIAAEAVAIERRDGHDWDEAREVWHRQLQKALTKIEGSGRVSTGALKTDNAVLTVEIGALQGRLEATDARIGRLVSAASRADPDLVGECARTCLDRLEALRGACTAMVREFDADPDLRVRAGGERINYLCNLPDELSAAGEVAARTGRLAVRSAAIRRVCDEKHALGAELDRLRAALGRGEEGGVRAADWLERVREEILESDPATSRLLEAVEAQLVRHPWRSA